MRPTLALAVLLPTSLAAVLGPNHDQAVLNSPHYDEVDAPQDPTSDESFWHHIPHKPFDRWIDGAKDRGTKLRNKVLADIKEMSSKLEAQYAEPDATQTIWQQIHEHPETSKFAEQVAKYSDIVDILNGTDARHTLFVPINRAFEHLPKHKKLSRDVVEQILKYHILPGDVSAKDALSSYTLPTLHTEKALGDEAQRLRPSFSVHGAKLNFYSTIVKVDVPASNGVIHAVDHILVPPPVIGLILTALPSRFSTLLLAYEKTNFVQFIHGQKLTGSTMFAPSNKAFKRLGPKINYFLFNTEEGHKYLLALLKYQIIPDITVYSDAVVDKRDSKGAFHTTEHRELQTLLDGAPMGVDTAKFLGLIFIRVNGFIDVAVHDGVAKNGVIHLVDQLPLPPRKRNAKGLLDAGDDISLEELKERLDDYL